MLSLRDTNGLKLSKLNDFNQVNEFENKYKQIEANLNGYVEDGYLIKCDNNYRCSDKGFLVLDTIINDLVV